MILVRIIKVRKFDDVKQTENETHMFQLFLSKRKAPVLKVQLPSSRFFLKSSVLRLSWLICQIFMNFSIQSPILQSRCESLGC